MPTLAAPPREISPETSLVSLYRTTEIRCGAPGVLDEQPFLMVAAGFALGYMTALLLHGRR